MIAKDETPADTPGAPKPRKIRGRTPNSSGTLFASVFGSSGSMAQLASPLFDSPTAPADSDEMDATLGDAFKDLVITQKRLPQIKAVQQSECAC